MPAGGSCLLGSLNLSAFVENPFTESATINIAALEDAVKKAIIGLNEVLWEGIELHPLEEQRESVRKWRQIGLGFMGLGDMFIKLGVRYGSEQSLEMSEAIGLAVINAALTTSAELTKTYGKCEALGSDFLDTDFFNSVATENTKKICKELGLANSQLLTCAPTGSIATMLGITGGIEPLFAKEWTRKTESLHGEDYYYTERPDVVEKVMMRNKEYPDYIVTAHDLNYTERIQMQAVWQKCIDASISSTINLNNEATVKDVKNIYKLAWENGLKGVTIYRDGCARVGILTTDTSKEDTELKRGEVIEVNNNVIGKRRKLITGCVDKDTEFFTGTGWKKISEYEDGDLVLQYNSDGTATLVKPLQYIKRPSNGQYHIKTKYGLDMMLSPDHRNVTFLKDNKYKIMTTEEIVNVHHKTDTGFARKFKLSFNYDGDGINLTDEEIRLSIAIFADGCFYSPTSNKCIISVKKKRKRDRLISLLEKANIEYSERVDDDNYYNVKFYPPLDRVKTFPEEWYNCSKHQLEIIFDEVFHWDGYEKENNQYTTIIKSNADFIQFVCSALGKRGSIYEDKRYKNTTYRVDWSDRKFASIKRTNNKLNIPLVQPEDGYDYCFSVPSTMLVLRRNDKIFITGNCGSLHVIALFDKETGELRETFLNKGSTGGCNSFMNGLSRMMSFSARIGGDVDGITDQLMSTGACASYVARTKTKHDTSKGSCCPMAVGYALREMAQEVNEELFREKKEKEKIVVEEIKHIPSNITENKELCPECGEPLEHTGGCDSCNFCGYTHCD